MCAFTFVFSGVFVGTGAVAVFAFVPMRDPAAAFREVEVCEATKQTTVVDAVSSALACKHFVESQFLVRE